MMEEIKNEILENVTSTEGKETAIGLVITTLAGIGALAVGKKIFNGAKKTAGKYVELKPVEEVKSGSDETIKTEEK